jgi:hypothetical protein
MSEQSTSSTVWEGLRPHLVHDIGAVDFAFASRQLFEIRPLIAVTALSFSGLMRSLVECELNESSSS